MNSKHWMIRPAFYSDPLVWSDLISWVFSAFQTFFSSPFPPLLSIWCSKPDSNDLTSYLDSSRTHFSHHHHNIKCDEKYQLQLRVCEVIQDDINSELYCLVGWKDVPLYQFKVVGNCLLWMWIWCIIEYCVLSYGKIYHSKVVGWDDPRWYLGA